MTSPTPLSENASASDLASLFGAEYPPSNPPFSGSDLASLFAADPTPSPTTPTPPTPFSSTLRAAQLSRLRAIPPPPPLKKDQTPELTSLRHQLELLLAENMITERIRLTKSAIIQRIRVLEAEEKKRVEDGKKVKLSREGLPEPVAKGEKEKLMKISKNVAKAKAPRQNVGGRARNTKRKRALEEEEDLDGEERLRLGLEVRKQKKRTKASGKWFSDIYGVK